MKGKISGVLKVVGVAAALALGTSALAAPHGGFGGGRAGGGHFAAGGHFAGGGHYGGGGHFSARGAPAAHFGGGRYYARGGVGRAGYGYGGFRGAYGYGGFRAWGGGYWGGAFWPGAYYGWSYPLFLAALPALYATYWWDSVPYYYVNNVYYTWNPGDNGYVATDPPPVENSNDQGAATDQGAPPADEEEQAAPPPPAAAVGATAPGDIMAYPKNGQSEQQQATDKYQCHSWARGQSGFDPTDTSSSTAPMSNRAAYQRAMAACLDARGYSTR